jgi:hypothetical protein
MWQAYYDILTWRNVHGMYFLNIHWILDVLYIKKEEQKVVMHAYSTVLPIWCFVPNLLWHSGSQSVLRRDHFLGDPWICLCNGDIKFIYY